MSDTQLVELAGRHYLISQLLNDGVEIALPIRDCGGMWREKLLQLSRNSEPPQRCGHDAS